MDTNLSIDSMFFAANLPVGPNPCEPPTDPKTNRFALNYSDDSPPPEAPAPQTPDNIPINDQPQQFQNTVRQDTPPDDQQPQEFQNSVRRQAPDDQKPQEFRHEVRAENADNQPNEFRHSVRNGIPDETGAEDSQYAIRGKMTIQQHLQLLGHKVSGEVEAEPTGFKPEVLQQTIQNQVANSLQQQNSAKLGINQNPVNLPAAKGENNSQVPLQQRVTAQVGQPVSQSTANKAAVAAGQQAGQVVSTRIQAENQNGPKTDSPQSAEEPLNNNLQLGQQDSAKVPLTNRENLQLQQGLVNEKATDKPDSQPPADQGQKMAAGVQKPINDVLPQVQDTKQKIAVSLQMGQEAAPKQNQNKAAVSEQNQAFWQSPNGSNSQQNGKTLGDSLAQHFGQAQVSLQTKERPKVTIKNGIDSDSGQTQTAANAQATVNQQTSTSAQVTAKTTTQLFNNGTYTSVKEQIQSSIQTSLRQGDQQITIRLNPPELGKVCIRFQNQQDQITGFVEVDKARTRYEIEQALPEIIRNLQNSGVQIKRLDVVVNDQAQHEYKEHSLQDPWAWQHNFAEQNRYENAPSSQWFTDAENYQTFSESGEIFVTDNSVNMLV